MFGIHLPLREIAYCEKVRRGDREGGILLCILVLAGKAVLT